MNMGLSLGESPHGSPMIGKCGGTHGPEKDEQWSRPERNQAVLELPAWINDQI